MSFQALARTWRPRRFDELVGQAHVVRALTHALENDKLHHALLFSGTRGVGKTTLARIIAKCLNCDNGVSAHPCRGENACATCREIDDGRFVDLIEVDAASRTGVDDTRELMDNVQYAPTRGRTKVYLIDEVHMLSKHSFNALLKTLEEPPPRVQFLLATTEPEKIPVTILSRCLQFPLKRLPVTEIAGQLKHIVAAESLAAQDEALEEIAHAADGSMRDGLSLLDQAIAFGGGALAAADVRDMLGTIGQARIVELVDAIVAPDAPRALDALAALYAQGIDMRYLLEALATAWQHVATIQIVGDTVDEAGQPWRDTAARADQTSVQIFYDICIAGIRDLAHAPDPLVGVKMSVLRMLAFAPAAVESTLPGETQSQTQPRPQPTTQSATPGSIDSTREAADRARARLETPGPAPPAASAQPAAATGETPAKEIRADRPAAQVKNDGPGKPSTKTRTGDKMPDANAAGSAQQNAGEDHPEDWSALVPKLGLSGFAAQLANNGLCRHMDDRRVVLALARANEFLVTTAARDALQHALAEHAAPADAPRLTIEYVDAAQDTPAQRLEQDAQTRQRNAEASIENDPFVRQLRDRLGATVRAETIKPNRSNEATQQREE